MEATVALPSHPPAMEGFSECCLAPRVWFLCVRAWPREVPILGLPQLQERNWGPRNQGMQDSSLIPRNLLGSECGARNWSPAQPQYCHLCTYPCKSPEDCPPQKLPTRENLCQLWRGWAWTLNLCSLPPPTLNRWAAPAVALTSPPVLSQCCSLLTSLLLPAHHWHVCCLLWFCSLAPLLFSFCFALAWRP